MASGATDLEDEATNFRISRAVVAGSSIVATDVRNR